MGVLDRWDARNQETLEFHQYAEERNRAGRPLFTPVSTGKFVAIVVGVWIAGRVLAAVVGHGWAAVVMAALSIVGFVFMVRDVRSKRRDWAHRRRTGVSGHGDP